MTAAWMMDGDIPRLGATVAAAPDKDTQAWGWFSMLEAYRLWLNRWSEINDPGDEGGILKDIGEYWLYGDGPQLLLDARLGSEVAENGRVTGEYSNGRVVTIQCSPYHDEGGPAVLTGFFEWAWETEGREGVGWELHAMTAEFDTLHSLVVGDWKLIWELGGSAEMEERRLSEVGLVRDNGLTGTPNPNA